MVDHSPGFSRKRMSAREFHESGLLYYVNSTVLWPLGLTLAVSQADATGDIRKRLDVMQIEPAETITDGFQDEPDHPRHRAARWIHERLASMNDSERDLSRALLRDGMNVAAFLEDEPDDHRHPRPVPD